jgi:hypothetical protein
MHDCVLIRPLLLLLAIKLELRGCRVASGLQLQHGIEGARRARDRPMPLAMQQWGRGESFLIKLTRALSVSALDAAIELARRGRFLLSEELVI